MKVLLEFKQFSCYLFPFPTVAAILFAVALCVKLCALLHNCNFAKNDGVSDVENQMDDADSRYLKVSISAFISGINIVHQKCKKNRRLEAVQHTRYDTD